MKRGYKRLLLFEFIIFVILLINIVFIDFLSNIGLCILLFISLISFRYLFGFEKDRHRYVKDILLDTTIFLIIFFIIYYLIGILVTFGKTQNYYNLYGIFVVIIPLIISIILKEYLRYMMLCKSDDSKLTTIITVSLFIFLDIATSFRYGDFTTNYNIFIFIARTVLPSISTNIVLSYVTKKVGYKPVIFYSLIVSLYEYLLPIVPNMSQYVYVLIHIILPLIFFYRVNKFMKKSDDEEIERDYYKKRHKLIGLVPVLIFVLAIVYLFSGYFKYWTIAIASGSMTPNIDKGDLVVINQRIDKQKLEVGQVLAYKNGDIIIVHRINEIVISKNGNCYITKGDANNSDDGLLIDEDMIIGIVEYRVPKVGIPTIWLHEFLG